MPKAQCTTCKKMVPLQILPVHITECKTELVDLSYSAEEQSCNEEHEDEFPDSICNQTDKVKCLCLPDLQIITAMSQVDQYQSVKSAPFKALRKSWIGSLVKLMKQTHFPSVSRTELFSRGMQQWQRQKKTSPKCRGRHRYWGPLQRIPHRTVVLHSTMRVIPMLDQLRKGLQLYDLPKIMKTHQDLCLPLFVPGQDDEADAAFLLEKSRPVFSEIGSAKHQKEVNMMNFLQEIEDSEQEGPSNNVTPEGLTAGRIMQWMTGQQACSAKRKQGLCLKSE